MINVAKLEHLADRAEGVDCASRIVAAARRRRPTGTPRTRFAGAKRDGRRAGGAAAGAPVAPIRLSDLHGIDGRSRLLEQNTRQFVAGLPANNVLLTGARGTGKSSLIKAVLNASSARACA